MTTYNIINVDGATIKVISLVDHEGSIREFFVLGEMQGGIPHFSSDHRTFHSLDAAILAHKSTRATR